MRGGQRESTQVAIPVPLDELRVLCQHGDIGRIFVVGGKPKADQACFAQALLSPPPPSPALKRAFARRNKLLRGE